MTLSSEIDALIRAPKEAKRQLRFGVAPPPVELKVDDHRPANEVCFRALLPRIELTRMLTQTIDLRSVEATQRVPRCVLAGAKRYGVSDRAIARCIGASEAAVRSYRKQLGIIPWVKQVRLNPRCSRLNPRSIARRSFPSLCADRHVGG